jgi:hypothetical protein
LDYSIKVSVTSVEDSGKTITRRKQGRKNDPRSYRENRTSIVAKILNNRSQRSVEDTWLLAAKLALAYLSLAYYKAPASMQLKINSALKKAEEIFV